MILLPSLSTVLVLFVADSVGNDFYFPSNVYGSERGYGIAREVTFSLV